MTETKPTAHLLRTHGPVRGARRRVDADWSLKMEGLRGMLPAVRLAESRGPDGR